ncbi:MAG: cobalamin biosynthesis protein [Clostridia bacterium]|nr:cobalamin biosynthesis protein [Clostridia bacterium]
MKLVVIAGPPSAGKTAVAKQIVGHLCPNYVLAYFKIDVAKALEDQELAREFGIATRKVYSGDLCPDHAGVMVLGDAIGWSQKLGADFLLVETAGLCLRCAPYLNQGVGIVVVSAISGIHAPAKMGPMVGLADVAVVTKIDLVSQAEREVLREKIRGVNGDLMLVETNALQGTALQPLYHYLESSGDIDPVTLELKGIPPLGTCTICVGKKQVGWEHHFGLVRTLAGAVGQYLYRGE